MASIPRHSGTTRRPNLGGRVAVGGIALGVVAFGVAHSLRVTSLISSPSLRATTQASIKQESCLRAEVRQRVPKGATVYLDSTGYNYQLLEQFVAAWAVPTKSVAESSMTVTLAVGKSGGCQGEYVRTAAP
jgi:hypothetical protein